MMKETLQFIGLTLLVVLIACLMFGLIVFGNSIAGSGQRVYNCSVAEFSPDFTTKMREECRKLRQEQR
jgi:hypothetical protein